MHEDRSMDVGRMVMKFQWRLFAQPGNFSDLGLLSLQMSDAPIWLQESIEFNADNLASYCIFKGISSISASKQTV